MKKNYIKFARDVIDLEIAGLIKLKKSLNSSFNEAVNEIAKSNSKVTSNQFQRFCLKIGSPIEEANNDIYSLFNKSLIENIFKVKEFVFNANILKKKILRQIANNNVDIRYFNYFFYLSWKERKTRE